MKAEIKLEEGWKNVGRTLEEGRRSEEGWTRVGRRSEVGRRLEGGWKRPERGCWRAGQYIYIAFQLGAGGRRLRKPGGVEVGRLIVWG
jgi:hypothetical protein